MSGGRICVVSQMWSGLMDPAEFRDHVLSRRFRFFVSVSKKMAKLFHLPYLDNSLFALDDHTNCYDHLCKPVAEAEEPFFGVFAVSFAARQF